MKYLLLVVSFFVQCMSLQAAENGFRKEKDVAQYKGSDYSNVVHVARGISLTQAFEIAKNNPEIDYFVYVKGHCMVLEIPAEVSFNLSDDKFGLASQSPYRYDSGEDSYGYCRIFKNGDTVFFKKDGIWLGSAPGLADTYIRE